MTAAFPLPVPRPPGFQLDAAALEEAAPFLAGLRGCAQDPRHHGEGDVLVHTRLVAEAMAADPAWRALDDGAREETFAGALLHDLGKPPRTRTEADGRVVSPGHARRGALAARALLYRADLAPERRERIAALVRAHEIPFHLVDRDDAEPLVLRVSQTARCDHLALLARADARGRLSAEGEREGLLERVELFAELCRELGCLDRPRAFASDHSRFLYFRRPRRDPSYLAHDDTRFEVVLLSGLPGAGKGEWARRHLAGVPVVSLDGIRAELGAPPGSTDGRVFALAEERARAQLRRERPFVFDATSLVREIRAGWIDLFAAYHARVRILAIEAPDALRRERNLARAVPVPEAVVDRMVERWEPPDPTEAPLVERVVTG
jgi:predicted kinase